MSLTMIGLGLVALGVVVGALSIRWERRRAAVRKSTAGDPL